tara:strand:- start:10278 stop:10637 length:360 start_codon:yes stop_codon:yes gene_type:complete
LVNPGGKMRYISKIKKGGLDDHTTEKTFNSTGDLVDNEKEKSYAKIVKNTTRSGITESHYIKVYNGVVYDPWGMHSHREDYVDAKMRRVSKETFDFYMLYLKTRNSLYLTRSQRSFIND